MIAYHDATGNVRYEPTIQELYEYAQQMIIDEYNGYPCVSGEDLCDVIMNNKPYVECQRIDPYVHAWEQLTGTCGKAKYYKQTPPKQRLQPKRGKAALGVSSPGYIYFALAKGLDRVKIGFATHVGSRVAQLQTACPVPLEIIGERYAASMNDERELHRKYAKDRVHGEWFHATEELLQEAQS